MSSLKNEHTFKQMKKILTDALDWQDALEKLQESKMKISERKAAEIVDKFFFDEQ